MFAFLLIQTDLQLLKKDFFHTIGDQRALKIEQFENSEREGKKKGNLHSPFCYYQCMRHDTRHFQESLAMFHSGIWIIGRGNRLMQLTN